jgi:TonB family protein
MQLIFLGIIFICTAFQIAAQKVIPQTPERCDFSAYKPIKMDFFPQGAVIKEVSPKYPKKAGTRKIKGIVSVKVLINEDGIVEKACVVNGNKIFWTEVKKAALQWRFKPRSGLAFTVQRQDKQQKRYAFAYIIFNFKPLE